MGASPLSAQWIVVEKFENVKNEEFLSSISDWKEFIEAEVPSHHSWEVFTDDQDQAVIISAIDSIDALQERDQKYGEAVAKMIAQKEEAEAGSSKALLERWRKSHTASERSIWKFREDLSTLPEAAGSEAEPPRFRRINSYVVAPGGKQAVEKWLKALHEFQDATVPAGSKRVRVVMESHVGADGHTIIVSEQADSEAAYYSAYGRGGEQRNSERWESLDEELKNTLRAALKEFRESGATRSVKNNNLRLRRGVSYKSE